MTTLIALHGAKGSGKDTAFGFLEDWAVECGVSAFRRGFADDLKLSFARLFIPDITREEAVQWMNTFKEHGALSATEVQEAQDTINEMRHNITGRIALQRYGTESHRDVFGEDFWVDQLLPPDTNGDADWVANFTSPFLDKLPEIAVITDCRFENEAHRVKELGGDIWHIRRPPKLEEMTSMSDVVGSLFKPDEHLSEAGISPNLIDLEIINDGTLDELKVSVRSAMNSHYAKQVL